MKKPTPFGKYYLLERINVGGMAEVFRAKAFGVEGFERLVAVKRILPNIAEDKEFIRMFIDEAKLAVQLNHANIAQIFDLGNQDGAYFIALEHVHGRDLRAVFDRCRQLGEAMPVAQACFMVMKVCEGLDYAHNKRDQSGRELHLVHRDVSPQNVLVSFEGEVKIIDFGIAKAAGKGSKTQAGILKGKFGYMSPEQVRGIPIDRRSDVFSCGIVLYELLTGERLFVGESDFSTLEKVRNVEILPPSTYNRKIPDELERIVLKALAKDVDDRYQNAIDLHDELQAFVYTAGEFYSRKDLAGWMKKQFGKEIEDETAKLESYRQLKAPTEPPPATARATTSSRPPPAVPPAATGGRRTMTQSVTKPPPPPRTTGQHAAVVAPPPKPSAPIAAVAAAAGAKSGKADLAWDDDELETQIYDDDGNPKQQPAGAGKRSGGAAVPAAAVAAAAVDGGPDLSSLVTTGKGWEPAKPTSSSGANPGMNGHGATAHGANGAARIGAVTLNGVHAAGTAPPPLANGTRKQTDQRLAATAMGVQAPPAPSSEAPPADPFSIATPVPMLGGSMRDTGDRSFEPSSQMFGRAIASRQGKRGNALWIGIGVAALAGLVVLVVVWMSSGSKPTTTATSGSGSAATTGPVGAADTGFDLYVNPAGVTQWKLDDQPRTDTLPSRIRGITPGKHTVTITPPPHYAAVTKELTVDAHDAKRVDIALEKKMVSAQFVTTPPGAKVTLIIDGDPHGQVLGASPQTALLDPTRSYQVLFALDGYVSHNSQVVFGPDDSQTVSAQLDKSGGATPTPTPTDGSGAVKPTVATGPVVTPTPTHTPTPTPTPTPVHTPVTRPTQTPTPHTNVAVTPPPPPDKPGPDETPVVAEPKGDGTLALMVKPPCEHVSIDGSPQDHGAPGRFKLSAGKHKVSVSNDEYNIHESFTVIIAPDAVDRELKDYTDKIPESSP